MEYTINQRDFFFIPDDVPYITSIPVSNQSISDTLIWPYSKDGVYSVRSGYHWLRETTEWDIIVASVQRIKWTRIWKLNIPPKMSFFFRLLHNDVPCNVNLQKEKEFSYHPIASYVITLRTYTTLL